MKLSTLIVAALLGGTAVDQGKPGTQGPWPVSVVSGGGSITIPDGGLPVTFTIPDGGLPVNVYGGTVSLVGTDVFGAAVTATRYNEVEVSYATTDPDLISTITVTKTNGGDAINSNGQAVFSTSTNATGGIRVVTNDISEYRPHAESYGAFTAIFTTGVANSYQRLGIYDTNDGFYVGYEGATFGVTIRKGGADTFTPRASFNLDTLTGAANSKYTRAGVPEVMDPTKDQLYRIRFGWLGAAPVTYEILSPDGSWVPFHVIRQPNSVAATTINNPNLPITLDARKTSGATNITISTACWAAGSTSDLVPITATLNTGSLAALSRAVITGQTTGGGGGFVNVKVAPSGALNVAATQDTSPWVVSGTGSTGAAVPSVASYIALRNGAGNLTGVQGSAAPVNGTGTSALVTTPVLKFATSPATSAVSCAVTATAIAASPLANRTSQCFINNGTNTIFIGSASVTTTNGFPLASGASFCDDSGSQAYFCIVASGTENLRVLEN